MRDKSILISVRRFIFPWKEQPWVRSRCLRQKTSVFVGVSCLIVLLCNYIALICYTSLPPVSFQDTITSIDSSFRSSSRIGIDYFNNSMQSELTSTIIENSTSTWKQMLKNKTSSSRIGIHILRPTEPATNIIVLGERHSGTTFFTNYLSNCFPEVNVRDTFINNKHWIQHDPEYVHRIVSNNLSSTPSLWRDIANQNDGIFVEKNQSANHYFKDSFLVVLFRNPYDW